MVTLMRRSKGISINPGVVQLALRPFVSRMAPSLFSRPFASLDSVKANLVHSRSAEALISRERERETEMRETNDLGLQQVLRTNEKRNTFKTTILGETI